MTEDRHAAIVKSVQSLLARADESSNAPEAERNTAMSKALGLLAKHNLAMVDVENTEDQIVKDIRRIRHGPWARIIWQAIAKLYFCKPLFYTGKDQRIIFYGKPLDIAIAFEISFWVQESLWKEGQNTKRELGGHNSHLTSFLNTASWRIDVRVDKIIEAAAKGDLKDADGSTMLVPMTVYEQAWSAAEDAWPGNVQTTKTRQSFTSYGGMVAGRAAADRINLGRQIGTTGRGQKMIE